MVNTASVNQDLSFLKLSVYLEVHGVKLPEDRYDEEFCLRTEDGRYNNLARLLSDNSNIPVTFAMVNGTSERDPAVIVRDFGDTCLFYAMDSVLDYGSVLNIPQADERDRIVTRKEIPLFDQKAFNAAVVNAFLHNDWAQLNAPVFTVYKDRIEILSHGGLPEGQTQEGLFNIFAKKSPSSMNEFV